MTGTEFLASLSDAELAEHHAGMAYGLGQLRPPWRRPERREVWELTAAALDRLAAEMERRNLL